MGNSTAACTIFYALFLCIVSVHQCFLLRYSSVECVVWAAVSSCVYISWHRVDTVIVHIYLPYWKVVILLKNNLRLLLPCLALTSCPEKRSSHYCLQNFDRVKPMFIMFWHESSTDCTVERKLTEYIFISLRNADVIMTSPFSNIGISNIQCRFHRVWEEKLTSFGVNKLTNSYTMWA